MEKVLITGGSGLVGTLLTSMLLDKGHEVSHFSRSPKQGGKIKQWFWDPVKGEIDAEAFMDATVIIHLAGANVGEKRWTEERKRIMYESRVGATRLIYESLNRNKFGVKKFVSASAIGIYGDRGDELLSEESSYGSDFLANLCRDWEKGAIQMADIGVNYAILRTGLVLAAGGGFLKELSKPIKYGFGAALGSGKQQMSWIHTEDLCRIYIRAAENPSFTGIYNAVAPNPVTQNEIIHEIAKRCHKPLWLPNIPAWAIKLVLGELGKTVLSSARVSSEKLQKDGFEFRFTEVTDALNDLMGDGR